MKDVCDEIEASLHRSKLLIEEEAHQRMYFYPQSRRGGEGNTGTGVHSSKGTNNVSQTGSINTLRLKKYWNIFPKKKNKKVTDTITSASNEPASRWSSTKDRYGTVSGSMVFDSDFQPKLASPSKTRGTLISPWENYSSIPEVLFEERDGGRVSPVKFSTGHSPHRKPKFCADNVCTCSKNTTRTYGSIRVTQFPSSCACSPKGGRTRFGTARPVMMSANRKSILSHDSNPFVGDQPTFDTNSDNENEDEIESDAAYGSMYDSSPVSSDSYSRIGKYIKNAKSSKPSDSSLYGTLRSRKSILECDVNPYELVRVQSKETSDDAGDVTDCDLEDDDLSINVLEKELHEADKTRQNGNVDDKSLANAKSEKKNKSKFSIYSKVDKGTLRIGGRAMAFHLQKERKMPKAYESSSVSQAKPPRRSLSVPDIRFASTKDDDTVIHSISSMPEPDPDYTSINQSSKVPTLTKLYNSLAPSKDSQSTTSRTFRLPSVSSIIKRKSRTPSPTRKASSPYQNNGVIYGIAPLRRPKAPPPPPPPPARKCVRQTPVDENSADEIANETKASFANRKMETIRENGDNQSIPKSGTRKTSFSGQTDFRSMIRKRYFSNSDANSRPFQDTCSETSSSAYGSMSSHSELKRVVKSILKRNNVEGTQDKESYGEKKKQVKFKSASDNSLLVEDINDKLEQQHASVDYCEEDLLSDDEDHDDDIRSPVEHREKPLETCDESNKNKEVTLLKCSDDFVSVGDPANPISSSSSKAKSIDFSTKSNDGIKFELRSVEDQTRTTTQPQNSIVGKNRVVFENNGSNANKSSAYGGSNIVSKTIKKFGSNIDNQLKDEDQKPPATKCSIRSWSSGKTNPVVPKYAISVNNNLKVQDVVKKGTDLKTKKEDENVTDAVEFPEFNPDDGWLSSKTASLSQQTPIAFPKNVEASPTMAREDNGSQTIMARGREPNNQHNSAKIEVHDSSSVLITSQVSSGARSAHDGMSSNVDESFIGFQNVEAGIQDVENKVQRISDPIYDIAKSGTVICSYLTEVCVDDEHKYIAEIQNSEEREGNEKSKNKVHSSAEAKSSVFLAAECLNNKLPEDSEIDALYDDIAGVSEPIYEELSNTNVTSPSPKSMFEGASKTEILSILNSAKDRVMSDSDDLSDAPRSKYVIVEEGFDEASSDPGIVLEDIKQQQRNHPNRLSNLSNLSDSSTTSEETSQADSNDDQQLLEFMNHNSHRRRRESAEIERNDSGVGSETSKPSKVRRHSSGSTQNFSSCEINADDQVCEDCEQRFDSNYELTDSFFPLVCNKCHKRRVERKEIITEIVETEIKYGNDLKILKEEFYKPMEVAGLLLLDQLQSIFINLDELRKMNEKFVEKLSDALEIANEQGDEDYSTVSIGTLFTDSTAMLHGFETYCVQQSTASMMLNNLEKDKELLRVFLGVSQMENTLLRRMNLHAFLMVPVQRVTKYPLLLNRLYKVTPPHHKAREALKEAQRKLELHLEHINLQTKGVGTTKIWRKISNISIAHRRTSHVEEVGNIKLRTMALELLQWNREEVHFMKEGRLLYTQPSECIKRNKSVKFISVHAMLVTLGRPDTHLSTYKATLLLVKEKGNRLALLREQLPLHTCVVSTDLESSETFEVQLILSRDYFICKANSKQETEDWAEELKKHAKDQGRWRQRRNALANIMISGMNRN